jgi:hypothetical protein
MNDINVTPQPPVNSGASGRNGFGNEVSLIPAWAYIVAAIAFIAFQWVMHGPAAQEPRPMPPVARLLVGIFGGAVIALWIVLVGYVNRDAKRRAMNRTLWTLLVIFVPNALGFILYFLIRKSMLVPCGHCGAMLQPNFRFCPKCATARFAVCGHCNAPTQPGDQFCNSCGRMLHEPMK